MGLKIALTPPYTNQRDCWQTFRFSNRNSDVLSTGSQGKPPKSSESHRISFCSVCPFGFENTHGCLCLDFTSAVFLSGQFGKADQKQPVFRMCFILLPASPLLVYLKKKISYFVTKKVSETGSALDRHPYHPRVSQLYF